MINIFDITPPQFAILAAIIGVIALGAPIWLTASLLLWLILSFIALNWMIKRQRRAIIEKSLRGSSYSQNYTTLTNWAVHRLWRKFSDTDFDQPQSPFQLFKNALTWRLYGRVLLISAAYPVLFLSLLWLHTHVGSWWGTSLTPSGIFNSAGVATISIVSLLIVIMIHEKLAPDDPEDEYFRSGKIDFTIHTASEWFSIAAFVMAFAFIILGWPNTATASATLGAMAFAVTGAGFGAIRCIIIGQSILVFKSAFILANTFAHYGVFPSIITGVIGFIIAILFKFQTLHASLLIFARAIEVGIEKLTEKFKYAPIFLFIFLHFIWAGFLWLLLLTKYGEFDRVFILSLGILLVISAVINTISYAITLAGLRLGSRHGNPILISLFGFAAALILFISLGFVFLIVVTVINSIAGGIVLDLAEFHGLRNYLPTFIWLGPIALFSLLPSAVHLGVIIISLHGLVPKFILIPVADLLMDDTESFRKSLAAPLTVGAVWTLPFLALGFGIYLLTPLVAALQSFGWWYIDQLLAFTQYLS